jgi:hypothetical protein
MAGSERRSFLGALLTASRANPRLATIVSAYLVVFVLVPCVLVTWLNVSKSPYSWWAMPLLSVVPSLPLIVGCRMWTYLKRRRGCTMAR